MVETRKVTVEIWKADAGAVAEIRLLASGDGLFGAFGPKRAAAEICLEKTGLARRRRIRRKVDFKEGLIFALSLQRFWF